MNRPARFPRVVEAALFDFDETMIDLEAQHDAAHRRLCESMQSDYDRLPDSFRFGSGRRIIDDVTEMRDFFGWRPTEPELYAERQRNFAEECRRAALALMPGVLEAVRALHARGVLLAVTTSADGAVAEEILERFGIREFFTAVVDGREVTIGKPDPEAYLVTARRLGVAPARCVVFEDSEAGVVAAKRAGMYCVAVRNPRARQRQDLGAADVTLRSFEELDAEWFDR